MQVFQTESKIIITCNKRLSGYLQQEVEALGRACAVRAVPSRRGSTLDADDTVLRAASRSVSLVRPGVQGRVPLCGVKSG